MNTAFHPDSEAEAVADALYNDLRRGGYEPSCHSTDPGGIRIDGPHHQRQIAVLYRRDKGGGTRAVIPMATVAGEELQDVSPAEQRALEGYFEPRDVSVELDETILEDIDTSVAATAQDAADEGTYQTGQVTRTH